MIVRNILNFLITATVLYSVYHQTMVLYISTIVSMVLAIFVYYKDNSFADRDLIKNIDVAFCDKLLQTRHHTNRSHYIINRPVKHILNP